MNETTGKQEAQPQRLRQRWQTWRQAYPALAITFTISAIVLLVAGGALIIAIFFWAIVPSSAPDWTGFNTAPHPLYTGENPVKNLWDWMGLLLIPLFLAFGAAIIGRQQQIREMREREFDRQLAEKTRENEWALERDRQEQAIVETYYENMSAYLLDHQLRASAPSDEVRTIARAVTLAALRGVNAQRKGQILQFLVEAQLIVTPQPIVDLHGADLRGVALPGGDLRQAHLPECDLRQADLNRADLAGANLAGSNLIDAELREASLTKSNLAGAYLSSTHLRRADLQAAVLSDGLLNNASLVEANLRQADLSGSNLVGADLSRAHLQGADLSQAKTRPTRADEETAETTLQVSGATYDTATVWPDDFDPSAHGAARA